MFRLVSRKEKFKPNEKEEIIIQENNDVISEIVLKFGNKYEYVENHPSCKHKWTAYLEGKDTEKCISHVVFHLHETFPNPDITVRGPYAIRMNGWGTFWLRIEIFWL